jgi:molybdate transport system regulatory protein
MQNSRNTLRPSFKVWLRSGEEDVIGKGGATLLKAIERYGSITKAARELGFSYKFAWDQLTDMEKKLGFPVISTKRGGITRGGAELTGLGRRLLRRYENTEKLVKGTIRGEKKWEEIRLKISARNRLKGVVKAVDKGDVTSIVKIEINTPATVTALITKEAVEDLKIKLGDTVEAVIKSTEIMVAKE